MKFVYFNSSEELIRLATNSIVYFESNGKHTNVITINKLRSIIIMNLEETEKALSYQLGPTATAFIKIDKRFIINRNYIYKINVQKQTLFLSDFVHFAFQLNISKESLKRIKTLLIQNKKQEQ